jgi:hypothetical protein
MTLGDILKYVAEHNVPLDTEVLISLPGTRERVKCITHQRHDKSFTLKPRDGENEKTILDFIAGARCSREIALKYLIQNNWNLPLALVCYSREQR